MLAASPCHFLCMLHRSLVLRHRLPSTSLFCVALNHAPLRENTPSHNNADTASQRSCNHPRFPFTCTLSHPRARAKTTEPTIHFSFYLGTLIVARAHFKTEPKQPGSLPCRPVLCPRLSSTAVFAVSVSLASSLRCKTPALSAFKTRLMLRPPTRLPQALRLLRYVISLNTTFRFNDNAFRLSDPARKT